MRATTWPRTPVDGDAGQFVASQAPCGLRDGQPACVTAGALAGTVAGGVARSWRVRSARVLAAALAAAALLPAAAGIAVAAPVQPEGGSGAETSQSESEPAADAGAAADRADTSSDASPTAGAAETPAAQPEPAQVSGAAEARAQAAADARAQAAAEQQAAQRAAAAAAQRAAREQQRAAAAAAQARAAWERNGHPNQMIIVRATSIDLVNNGQLSRRVPRAGGPVTLAALDAAAPAGWVSSTGGTVGLGAALVLNPGVRLEVGGAVKQLQLLGGAQAADAASIYTGGGQLNLQGVTVSSLDRVTGAPVAVGAGRPFIYVSPGGRLDATDTTFTDLGTPAVTDSVQDRAAVSFGTGATGSLVRSTVQRATTGVQLSGSAGVRLDGLTVTESLHSGLAMHGDRATVLTGVRAERNGEHGVQVTGPSTDRPITGIATTGNAGFGLAVISQQAPRITGVTTTADRTGGLQLAGVHKAAVSDFTAIDEPIGIRAHLSSTEVNLDRLRISGGGKGVVAEKTTDGMVLTGSTIQNTETGVSLGGRNADLRSVSIEGSRSAVRVERGAWGVDATSLNLTGGEDGVVVSAGTADVVLRDLRIDGVGNTGVRTAGPGVHVIGGQVSGTTTGIDAQAATTISGTEITASKVGIRGRSTEPVHADAVAVSGVSTGIDVAEGSPFVLTDSRVDALQAVTGPASLVGLNQLSLPPLNVISVIGIPLIVLALVLDQVQRLRQRNRGDGQRKLPPPRLQLGTN